MRHSLSIAALLLAGVALSAKTKPAQSTPNPKVDPATLNKAYRFDRDGWTYVHLEGSPYEVGYEHGTLLAKEIEDSLNAERVLDTHESKRDWAFFRNTAKTVLWPHIDAEYQQELQGITDGVRAKNVPFDLWDIVAYNAAMEVPGYYVPWLDKQHGKAVPPSIKTPAERCSAFVATGSYTKDGRPVMAHNNWTQYINGARWRVIEDIVPAHGHRILQDALPGFIVSDDDFGINDAGLMVTETTISGFNGYDPNGKPEFVRARKALQYADGIDAYMKIMLDGNNGGYANDWLLADRNTGEVARFELGLKHHNVWRSKDGYFVGSNFPSDPALRKDETTYDPSNLGSSQEARRVRWEQLMSENKGKIDIDKAEAFLADHYDSYDKKEQASERTLCGHNESSPRGMSESWGPYYPAGSAIAQAADASMAEKMTMAAQAGHSCRADFSASQFLKDHPEFEWQRPALIDMKGYPWSNFTSGQKQ